MKLRNGWDVSEGFNIKLQRKPTRLGIGKLIDVSKNMNISIYVGWPEKCQAYPDRPESKPQQAAYFNNSKWPILERAIGTNRKAFAEIFIALSRNVLRGFITANKAIKTFADYGVQKIKVVIWSRMDPPNASSTQKKKGFNHPMVETAHLYDQVTWIKK